MNFAKLLKSTYFVDTYEGLLLKKILNYVIIGRFLWGASSRGKEVGFSCPVLKIERNIPGLVKKCPDCVHVWVKCII